MASEAPTLPLSEIVRHDSPITYGVVKPGEEDPGGVPFIRSGDVGGGSIDTTSLRTITSEVSKQYRRTLLEGGEILVSLVGNPGQASIVPECLRGANIARQVALLRVDPAFSRDYIYYYLTSRQGRSSLLAYSKGSVQQVINLGDLQKVEIPIPPIKHQKSIAHILGTLDDKIELNRKTNETLEGIAKALFKSWFVDFDPVRAKAEGRPTGLPDEISELFPDSLEESELGEIPSGWTLEKASDLYQVTIGKTPPRKESWWFSDSDQDIPWLSIKDMGDAFVYAMETSEYLTRDAVNTFNVRIVPRGTVLVSFKLTVGRVAIAPSEMLTNEAIAHFAPLGESIPASYSYCLLSSYDYASLGSTSSIATAVNSKMLREMRLLNTPGDLKKAFDQMMSPIFLRIQQVIAQTKLLEESRDALLPRLISGELRVPDAEKILGEVGI